MTRKLAILAVALCGVAVALFFCLRRETPLNNPPAATIPAASQPITTPAAAKTASRPPAATQSSPTPVYAAVPTTAPAKAARRIYPLQFTNIPPDRVMDNMRIVFHEYASMFGGNPVGTNPEITAALSGKNPKQANFINPEAGMRIDAQGELIDPWGTPFFFHQLSGTVMEIHSAGPDRIMWSDDDLVIK
ncbi:MAG TPA: hypothetical protein VH595_05580 [Verrucomicrobiae bacterium]|jgi:hypothetical protein|nr:hypothetical protein [Verrucomicrobiae bacterium]